jgi:Integrase zinc binding domain
MLGHPGEKRTTTTITQHLIWPKLHEHVVQHVAKCKACQLYKGQKKKYGHLPIKDVEAHPWRILCVDLIGPYTVCNKKGTQSLHAMTMFDPATSWFEVVEIPNKRAITCANLEENTWLCRYPRPTQCIFDNGSEFLGAEFANTLDIYGIKRVPTTIKNPAANMVERIHQTLGNLLRVYELEEYEFPRGDPWSNVLASAAWAIRSTFHTTLGSSPGQLVYGCAMLFANRKNIKERKKAQIEDSNKRENAKRISHNYKVGDVVSKDQNQLQPKLHRPRDGTYTIEKVYTNGTLKIRKGITSNKILIHRVNPYNA